MDYVTGTSDALDTNQILDMMFTQNPDIGSVGLLYSLSEPNSEVPIADAKAYLDAKGVAYTCLLYTSPVPWPSPRSPG